MKTNTILQGDCIEKLKELPENSVDAVITDPPYGIGFMGKEWDNFKLSTIKEGMDKDTRPKTQIASTRISNIAGTYDLSLNGNQKFQLWFSEVAKGCLRVLKPGGFLLSFGGTRTYHRLVCGIEDAGFEIRDTIMWLYGSGFPKSLNIGKQIDKMNGRDEEQRKELARYIRKAIKNKGITLRELRIKLNHKMKGGGLIPHWITQNSQPTVPSKRDWLIIKPYLELDNKWDWFIDRIEAEREVIGEGKAKFLEKNQVFELDNKGYGDYNITLPNTNEAKEWEGWGTALKPACEPIVVARKPLSEKNVALNVLKWGTGGINIDESRIEYTGKTDPRTFGGSWKSDKMAKNIYEGGYEGTNQEVSQQGRFPANIILDEEAGEMLDKQSGISKSNMRFGKISNIKGNNYMNDKGHLEGSEDYVGGFVDNGGASRFFYCAKASKSERNFGCEDLDVKLNSKMFRNANNTSDQISEGFERFDTLPSKNNHPTVKPIKLMEYLIKLVSKEGAIILDPFLGSGTTAIACVKLNRKFIGIEKEGEYIKIAKKRLKPFLEQEKLI